MTAQKLAKEWENGNIVACKQSLESAYRHLKNDLPDAVQKSLVGLIEYTRLNDRENFNFKNWKIKK